MKYLLDTNVWVAMLRNTSTKIARRIEDAPVGELLLCSITLAELFYGAWRSQRRQQNLDAIAALELQFECLLFDRDAAEAYARIRTQVESAGAPIGANDLLIAAIAVSQQLTVVTNNVREFERVDGLLIEDWQ